MSSRVRPTCYRVSRQQEARTSRPGPLKFFGFVRLKAASWTGSSGSYVKSCARAASGPTASPDPYAVSAAYKPLLRHFVVCSRTISSADATYLRTPEMGSSSPTSPDLNIPIAILRCNILYGCSFGRTERSSPKRNSFHPPEPALATVYGSADLAFP